MSHQGVPNKEAETLVGAIIFEELPKFLNSKNDYLKWAVARRLEGKEFSMRKFQDYNMALCGLYRG